MLFINLNPKYSVKAIVVAAPITPTSTKIVLLAEIISNEKFQVISIKNINNIGFNTKLYSFVIYVFAKL